jgi:hypothetical protein
MRYLIKYSINYFTYVQNSIPDRGKLFDVLRAHFEETEGAFVNVSALDDDQLILKIVGLGFNEEFVLSAFVG